MLARVIVYAVPSIAVAVTAAVLIGPASTRPSVGVRVLGLPREGGRVLALRLEGVRRLWSADDPAPIDGVVVEAIAANGERATWRGDLGRDGVAEARLSFGAPLAGEVALRATREGPDGAELAAGRVPLGAQTPPPLGSGALRGIASGDLGIEVVAERGRFAAPFAETLRVTVRSSRAGAAGPALEMAAATIEASAPGASIEPERTTTDARGAAALRVTPHAHVIDLAIAARDALGRSGRWEGHLPVLPGAMWLDPRSSRRFLAVVSPAPHERAYVSIMQGGERVFGAVVPLARDARGFYAGEAAIEVPEGEPAFATIAGDPREQGAGTIAWPLAPGAGAAAPTPIELLIDGVPAAVAREGERAGAARRTAALVMAAAAALEIALLLARSRADRRRLEAHLQSATAGEADDAAVSQAEAPDASPARGSAPTALLQPTRFETALQTAVYVLLVAFGFAVLAAITLLR